MCSSILTVLLLGTFTGGFAAADQNLDRELSSLAEKLGAQIKDSGKKKVSVADFSDLQGNYDDLGRLVAEHLTVNMVTSRKGFSVIDRANLKRILEEHKLSMSGLVDPENAKKLGQVSGVDAIILGNVITFKSELQVTAKIIATDTAEIVGAGKFTIANSEELKPDPPKPPPKPQPDGFQATNTVQKFEHFNVELLSFRVSGNGTAFAAFQILNTSKDTPIAVALNSDATQFRDMESAKIMDAQGKLFQCNKVDGLHVIGTVYYAPQKFNAKTGFERLQVDRRRSDYSWVDSMAEIRPGEVLRFTLEFASARRPARRTFEGEEPAQKSSEVFNLQAELITIIKKGYVDQANPKRDNIYFDKIVAPVAPTADSSSEPQSQQPQRNLPRVGMTFPGRTVVPGKTVTPGSAQP
jgi:TolB-like protein